MPLHQLVRRDRREVAVVGHPQPAGLGDLGADADRRQQLGHDRHVDDRRHVGQLVGAVGEDRRRHQLEHGVLGAGHVDGAVQLADAAHDDLPGCGHHATGAAPPNPIVARRAGARSVDIRSLRSLMTRQYAPAVLGGGHDGDRPDAAQLGRERRGRIAASGPTNRAWWTCWSARETTSSSRSTTVRVVSGSASDRSAATSAPWRR